MLENIVALLVSANPAYYSSGQWSVFQNEDNCAAIASFENNTTLWISHQFGLNRTTFVIMDPALKSVSSEKEYKLQLYFSKAAGLDDGWGDIDVSGFELDNGEKGVRFVLRGSEALDDVATSKTLGLMRDDVVVESLSLSGSQTAMTKLRACAKSVEARNPSDPLAGAEVR